MQEGASSNEITHRVSGDMAGCVGRLVSWSGGERLEFGSTDGRDGMSGTRSLKTMDALFVAHETRDEVHMMSGGSMLNVEGLFI